MLWKGMNTVNEARGGGERKRQEGFEFGLRGGVFKSVFPFCCDAEAEEVLRNATRLGCLSFGDFRKRIAIEPNKQESNG